MYDGSVIGLRIAWGETQPEYYLWLGIVTLPVKRASAMISVQKPTYPFLGSARPQWS